MFFWRCSIIFLICFSLNASARIDTSLVLDGRGNYHEINDHNDLDFNGAMTIEMWIKPNCTDNGTIVSKQWCQGQFAYYLGITNGKLRWVVSSAGTCNNNALLETDSVVVYPDVFTHVAVTQTNSAAKIFVNGQEAKTSYVSGSFQRPMNSREPLRIGGYKGYSGNMGVFYSGLMDELRFWKKELSGSDIRSRMNTALNGNETDLVLYLDMEDSGVGSSVNLRNKSSYGSTFNPVNRGTTTYTSFFTTESAYEEIGLNLPDSIISCKDSIIRISPSRAFSIEWSDQSTDTFITLKQTGLYWVEVETERCRYYKDSIQYIVDGMLSFAQGLSLCRGDTLWIGSEVVTTSGTYYDTVINSNGCDTLFQFGVILFEPSDTNVTLTACLGDTVHFLNNYFLQNKDTSFVLQNQQGCDSTINLSVQFLLPSDTNIVISACEGDVINFMGNQYTQDIDTTFTLTNAVGCDSLIDLKVEFLKESDTSIHILECAGGVVSFLGRTFTQSVDTIFTLTNALGCDSTIRLDVTFIESIDTVIERTICPGSEMTFLGVRFMLETDTLFKISSHLGCDSMIHFSLRFYEPTDTVIERSICSGGEITYLGVRFSEEKDTVFTIPNHQGCDSIIQFSVVVAPITDTTFINRSICKGGETSFMGVRFNRQTDTIFIISNLLGCDSIIHFELTISDYQELGFLGRDTVVCGSSYELNSPSTQTRWSTGQIIQSIQVKKSAVYTASFVGADGCTYRDSISVVLLNDQVYLPNAFTPNGDGLNDCLRPILSGDPQDWSLSMKVYSRWGELIYQSNDPTDCWDGTYQGEKAQIGAYLWMIHATNEVCRKYYEYADLIYLLK